MRPRSLLLILVLFLAMLGCLFLPNASAEPATASNSAAYECEGNACSVITMAWENDRQQFRVTNDSDQPVKVEVTTFAGSSSISVPPHKSEYLEVKTFTGPYNATFE